jgi:hypothetical protein
MSGKAIALGAGIVGVVGLVLIVALAPKETDGGLKRIEEGCKREFAWRGQEAVNACTIKLMIELGDKFNRDALDRARR